MLPALREGCQRLQPTLSRRREERHHAACLQLHVEENSWEKPKHRAYASACRIPRAVLELFTGSLG